MKAKPVKMVYGEGYFDCPIEEVTHVKLKLPWPCWASALAGDIARHARWHQLLDMEWRYGETYAAPQRPHAGC